MQAVSDREGLPDVTVYRRNVGEVVDWKDAIAAKGLFSRFLLRHAVDAWDVYDASGKLESLCDNVVGQRVGELPTVVFVDRDILAAEAARALGAGVSCLTACAGHAGAPAADHSNFGTMLRMLITDGDDADLRHLSVVESHTWRCRVGGVFANVSALSPTAQNMFLDSFGSITNSKPLDAGDHRRMLVNRLASLRVDHLCDVCAEVGAAGGLDEEDILSIRLNVSTSGVEFRRGLAEELIRLTGKCPTSPRWGVAESLDANKLLGKRAEVMAAAFKM